MAVNQFDRRYRLTVDRFIIEKLDISFRVTRTLTKEPNTIDLSVFNMRSRSALQRKKEFVVQLEAGYFANFGSIFLGDVRSAYSTYEKPNWVTKISSGDGEEAVQKGRINKSFAAGTDFATVLQEAAKALPGIGNGNLGKAVLKGKLPAGAQAFVNGVTLNGNAAKQFDRVCRSGGLQWSIQDKKLQILAANETLESTAVVLTPYSGLIGSPTLASDGILNLTALLNPNIVPGRQLVVKSRYVDGRFKAEKCTYTGDTSGKPWYVNVEARELK